MNREQSLKIKNILDIVSDIAFAVCILLVIRAYILHPELRELITTLAIIMIVIFLASVIIFCPFIVMLVVFAPLAWIATKLKGGKA